MAHSVSQMTEHVVILLSKLMAHTVEIVSKQMNNSSTNGDLRHDWPLRVFDFHDSFLHSAFGIELASTSTSKIKFLIVPRA